jgi:hypothetical protein
MSVQLSVTAQALIDQIGINPQIILEIEGLDLIFGALPILKTARWDDESPDAIWDGGATWDGKFQDIRSRDWISLDETTTNITQQIAPDKGSTSSISTVNISIIDVNNEVSKAIAFDSISDILGRKATFSIGFAQGAYPEDANPIFRGVVVDFFSEAGKIMISLASPEVFKRQLFLEKFQTAITSVLTNSQTTIPVQSTAGIYPAQDALDSFIRVDDEIMRIVSIDSSTQLTVTRGQLNTVANPHDNEASVDTFYTLTGKPLDLALKVMLSSEGNEYFNSLDLPKSIEFISLTEQISNALIFDYYDIKEKTGLTIGDSIQLDSALNAGTYTIDFFGQLDNGGSYIVLNEPLTLEVNYTGTFKYRSKYNTLSTGLGMLTNEVDVDQFELIDVQYGNNFVEYEIYIKDSIDNAKDFIDSQIFFPQGLYSIPRKARSSVKFVAPPFSSDIVPYIGVDNVLNASKIKQRRSVHKYHYNTFVYRYNVDSIDDKYLTGKVIISADSLERIPVGKKQLRIESDGLRNTPETTNMINNVGQRQLDRYQYAPVYYDDIEVNYKTGYGLEVGDVVPFGGSELKISDLQTGAQGTKFQLFEIINKSLNVKNGNIKLSLVSTAFDIASRYAVVGLSSILGSGSTVNRIKIERFLDTEEYFQESDKWLDYEGQIIAIRSPDYTYYHEVELKGVDPSDNGFLLLEDSLPSAPLAGYVVEPADYANSAEVNEKFKIEFAHFNAEVTITSVTSQTVVQVNDASKLVPGSSVVVNSKDYSRDSFGKELKIDSIVGNQVTFNTSIGFLPLIGDLVNNSNYQDNGTPYVFI